MSRGYWSFDILTTDNPLTLKKLIGGGIGLKEIELNLLWFLGRKRWKVNGKKGKKTLTIYDLARPRFFMPESVGSLRLTHEIYEGLDEMVKKGATYAYQEILKGVNSLEQKGLLKTKETLRGRRRTREVLLTFLGAIAYLRESNDKHKFMNIRNNYPNLLPFFHLWEPLRQIMGENQLHDSMERTMNRCRFLLEATLKVKPLNLEFKGYLEKNFEEIMLSKDIPLKRDEKSLDFLSSKEGKVLKDSYIAFLAVHDILRLSEKSKAEAEQTIPSLKSEKELAFFENRSAGSGSLFEGKRLREFFPKYARLEFFITGMFAEELLYPEKDSQQQEECDFEVEF